MLFFMYTEVSPYILLIIIPVVLSVIGSCVTVSLAF